MNLAGEKKTYEPLALLSTLMLMSFFARFQLQIVNMGFFRIFNDSFQRLIHMSAGSSLVTELSTHVTTLYHSTCTIRNRLAFKFFFGVTHFMSYPFSYSTNFPGSRGGQNTSAGLSTCFQIPFNLQNPPLLNFFFTSLIPHHVSRSN